MSYVPLKEYKIVISKTIDHHRRHVGTFLFQDHLIGIVLNLMYLKLIGQNSKKEEKYSLTGVKRSLIPEWHILQYD